MVTRRRFRWMSILISTGCLLFAMLLTASAQSTDSAREYMGESECNDCHGNVADVHELGAHALALFDATDEDNTDLILGDFSADTDLLNLQLPDAADSRPVEVDDIAFVIGQGRFAQNYVIRTESDEYFVLPVTWDTRATTWTALNLAESWPDEAYSFTENCVGCHVTGYDLDSGEWAEDGVQCETCHGPGSEHIDVADETSFSPDDDELAALANSIVSSADADMCGQCHSYGIDNNRGLPFPVNYDANTPLTDQFTLVATDDPVHWWRSGHAKSPNMQYNEWLLSAHADSLDSVLNIADADNSCLTCHSTDETLDTAEYGITCTGCHISHPDEDTMQPMMLRETGQALCDSCHADTPDDAYHAQTTAFMQGDTLVEPIPGIATNHATHDDGPTCYSCHMSEQPDGRNSHTFAPVMPGLAEAEQNDTCTGCHTDLTRNYAQRFITNQQEDVIQRVDTVQNALASVESPEMWLTDAVNLLAADGSNGVHNVAYTEAMLNSVEMQLGLRNVVSPLMTVTDVTDPAECAECHADQHDDWLQSSHAMASLADSFREVYAANGQPSYCLRCHASGYDPATQSYQFEGVVCSSCHSIQGEEHPPAPVSMATSSETCGTCHSGGHASVYEEWLTSEHNQAGVDCVDCHTAHTGEMLIDDNINTTCGDCHANAMNDDVHMGEDMVCTDCHMTPRQDVNDPTMISVTGHSMDIDPSVCADCHGNTHDLEKPVSDTTDDAHAQAVSHDEEIAQLEAIASENLTSGLMGGAIGVLLLLGLIYLVLRLGRIQ